MTTLKRIYKGIYSHWGKTLLILFTLACILYGLYWLLLFVGIILLFRYVSLLFVGLIKNKIIQKLVKNIGFLTFLFLISIGAKLFVFGVFKIPSSSMESTLYPNDIIFVNKLIYGPKLPRSPLEIPWLNFLFYSSDDLNSNKDTWGYHRFLGTGSIKQGDVLVFKRPNTEFMVKRCVAIPGDKLEMDKGEVFVGGKKYKSPETIKNKYNVEFKNSQTFYSQIDSLKIESIFYRDYEKKNIYTAILSEKESNELKALSSVLQIEKRLDTINTEGTLFLDTKNSSWGLDKIDAFIVPKKGLKIKLDSDIFNLYQKTILTFEEKKIKNVKGKFYLNGDEIKNYTFTKDYIFVLGDNRKNSQDSRYIGFIPEENVVGKVQCVLFSNYDNQFQWSRFLKSINK